MFPNVFCAGNVSVSPQQQRQILSRCEGRPYELHARSITEKAKIFSSIANQRIFDDRRPGPVRTSSGRTRSISNTNKIMEQKHCYDLIQMHHIQFNTISLCYECMVWNHRTDILAKAACAAFVHLSGCDFYYLFCYRTINLMSFFFSRCSV